MLVPLTALVWRAQGRSVTECRLVSATECQSVSQSVMLSRCVLYKQIDLFVYCFTTIIAIIIISSSSSRSILLHLYHHHHNHHRRPLLLLLIFLCRLDHQHLKQRQNVLMRHRWAPFSSPRPLHVRPTVCTCPGVAAANMTSPTRGKLKQTGTNTAATSDKCRSSVRG